MADPVNPITKDSTQFQFEFGSTELPYYLDIKRLHLMAWLSITKTEKATGVTTPVTQLSDNCIPLAWLPDAIFESLDIYLNGYKITGSLSYRHVYVQLLKTICFNKAAVYSYAGGLECGRINQGDSTDHTPHTQTAKMFGQKVPTETVPPSIPFVSVLTHPLCGITEKLPPKTSIRIVLTKAPDAALLLSGPHAKDKNLSVDVEKYSYKLQINKMVMFCRRYQMLDKILISDKEKMNTRPAKFFYYRPISSWVNIPAGTNFTTQTIFKESDMVAKIWLVFYDQSRLSGDVKKSLAFFERPHDLESIEIMVGVCKSY